MFKGRNPRRLRARCFLSPGLPETLFERVVERLESTLDCGIALDFDSRSSGPMCGHDNPFAADDGDVDIGFVCAPSYLFLSSLERPSVDLVPAGFVFDDPRSQDRSVYFSEVVVRRDHAARRFEDLEGGVWGFNDRSSLSGFFAAAIRLDGDPEFFASNVCTGSHRASIDAVLAGHIDAASIDSNALSIAIARRPELAERLRVLESWGPFPSQPIVVRRGLGPGWAERIAESLLTWEQSSVLSGLGMTGFAPVTENAFAAERSALRALGYLPTLDEQAPQHARAVFDAVRIDCLPSTESPASQANASEQVRVRGSRAAAG